MALALQKVPEAKHGKNRLHFDVYVDDLEAATAHVEELGGGRCYWRRNFRQPEVSPRVRARCG